MACISHGAATFAANAIELVAGVPLETDANVGARAEVVAVRATGPPRKTRMSGTRSCRQTRGFCPL